MRSDLAEDPAVIAIAERLNLDEFAVVGRLHAFWSWIDRQSRDGRAVGVTHSWLDRYVRCDGFAAAVASVGWLQLGEDGLAVPNFDRHNGETAKARALNTRNKQVSRSADVPPLSRNNRDNSATREEKRREEKKEDPTNPRAEAAAGQPAKTRKKTATHITEEWRPTDATIAKAGAECPAVDVERVIPEFRRYWIGEGKPKSNWDTTFLNRVGAIDADIRAGNKRAISAFAGTDRRTTQNEVAGSARKTRTAAEFGNRNWRDIRSENIHADTGGEVPAVPVDAPAGSRGDLR